MCVVVDGDMEQRSGPGAADDNVRLVRACCGDEVPNSEFLCTEDSSICSTRPPVSSKFVCALGVGVGYSGRACLYALELSLVFACLTETSEVNCSAFESVSWAVSAGGHVAQCPSCPVSVYP